MRRPGACDSLNQLQMMKWMLNDVARHQYQPDTSRLLGFIFDGVARHTQEGLDFVARAQEVGEVEATDVRGAPGEQGAGAIAFDFILGETVDLRLGSGDLVLIAAVGANVHYGAQLIRL